MHMDKNGKEFGYMKYDSRPTVCKCGGKVIYGRMKDFGITPYKSGYCYFCTKCGAYVGTHENRKKDALGVLSDGRTRRMRWYVIRNLINTGIARLEKIDCILNYPKNLG